MPFINSLFTDIGITNVPTVLGELGEFLVNHNECSYSHLVNKDLEEIASEEKNFAFVSAKGLVDNGDLLHFNAKSLREFGRRYASSWQECSKRISVTLD